ncbi:MAG: ZIP family metal transporter [Candidatus Nanoarchaeia archaeon]|nr:ZIP family metal transporter [Candidatus Nanoarchaeia archaeon]
MISRFWIVAIAGLIACTITTIGIYIINRFSEWGKRNMVYFTSFASGVLISVSFMHIIPESIEMNKNAPIFLLVGFFSLYLINRFLKVFVCHGGKCDGRAFGIIPTLGIGFHSFIDGVIYSITFSVSVLTGGLAALGMILHEFPEGIVTYLLLMKSGFNKKKSSFYAFLAAALTTPLGVFVSWPFISKLKGPLLGVLLSLSAGALIYVGATHLLPEVEKESKKYSLLALAAGIMVAVVIILSHS